jgi:hypothetical protein
MNSYLSELAKYPVVEGILAASPTTPTTVLEHHIHYSLAP